MPRAMDGAGGFSGHGEDSQGGQSAQQTTAQKRLQQTQAQVEEVVGIMKSNVEKVMIRDEKLSELDLRADALQQGASQFEQQAGKLKRKYWWKNLKMWIIMGIILLVLIIIIVVWIVGSTGDSEPDHAITSTTSVPTSKTP